MIGEIAGALVNLGSRSRRTDAAERVRAQAIYGKTVQCHELINGQTVADWIRDFVPVVSQRSKPTE